MVDSPCKGCADRAEGCHDRCDRYLYWKKELKKAKQYCREQDRITISTHSIRKRWRNLRYNRRRFKDTK